MSDWAVQTMVSTTLLIALVMLLRRPVARHFGARAAYALWLAPLLRFVVPPIAEPIKPPQLWIDSGTAAAATLAPASTTIPVGTILLSLWLGGAALFLLFHFVAYRRFLRAALGGATTVTEPGIDDAAILASDAVTGPAATGLIVRRIFVPNDFDRQFSPEERRLAMRHEALHHRRGDLWASAVALVALALHWFNPLAHAAHRAFRRDLEAACDADLLSRADAPSRQAYARTILRCVARPVPHPICALTDSDEVKGRIAMMNQNHGRLRRLAGTSIGALLAGGGLMFALPATGQEAAPERTEIRKIVTMGGEPGTRRHLDVKDCPGEVFEATADGEDGTKKTRILLCGKAGATKAQAAESLERALARIEGESAIPAANKAQIVARLKARIAELRAGD